MCVGGVAGQVGVTTVARRHFSGSYIAPLRAPMSRHLRLGAAACRYYARSGD